MKIKRLTAGLAVAAMAATFFAAAPIVSANAVPASTSIKTQGQVSISVNGGQTTPIDVWSLLINDPTVSGGLTIQRPYSPGADVSPTNAQNSWVSTGMFSWTCVGQSGFPTVADAKSGSTDNMGTVRCDPTTQELSYTPNFAMGVAGDYQVVISYQLVAKPGNNWPLGWTWLPVIQGTILVTVTAPVAPSACDPHYTAQCLNADVQAYAKKAKATSVKVELLTPNAVKASAKGFVDAQGIWGLGAINNADSNDKTLSFTTLMSAISFTYGPNSSVVTFTPPLPNWSGTVTYEYVLASYVTGVADNPQPGLLTFTVHPTLPGIDPIASDTGDTVTIPVLEQSIIGSGAFSHASCTFANTKGKTTLSSTGSISNKGSKDPVFTPNADFVGSVDLSCTVQDVWGITSNTITVTVTVGAAAPVVPAAPTASPACGNGCSDGKLVSTGGSLATPMSSGLAAVVLLVAAGAGILVVRRRTALAG